MVPPTAGEVVLVPFLFSDLSQSTASCFPPYCYDAPEDRVDSASQSPIEASDDIVNRITACCTCTPDW